MVFVIHRIPIPPPTSLSTRSLWVFPVYQVRALVSCIWRLLRWTPETPLRREDTDAEASGFLMTSSAPRGLKPLLGARWAVSVAHEGLRLQRHRWESRAWGQAVRHARPWCSSCSPGCSWSSGFRWSELWLHGELLIRSLNRISKTKTEGSDVLILWSVSGWEKLEGWEGERMSFCLFRCWRKLCVIDMDGWKSIWFPRAHPTLVIMILWFERGSWDEALILQVTQRCTLTF